MVLYSRKTQDYLDHDQYLLSYITHSIAPVRDVLQTLLISCTDLKISFNPDYSCYNHYLPSYKLSYGANFIQNYFQYPANPVTIQAVPLLLF